MMPETSWADSTTAPLKKMLKPNWSNIRVGAMNWKLRMQSSTVNIHTVDFNDSYLKRSNTVKLCTVS
jgi:hypothetical protein